MCNEGAPPGIVKEDSSIMRPPLHPSVYLFASHSVLILAHDPPEIHQPLRSARRGLTESHIFDPLFTPKEPGNEAGLGPPFAYRIVQRLNGQIQVNCRG